VGDRAWRFGQRPGDSVVDRIEPAFYAGDEIGALAYPALAGFDQARDLVRIDVERVGKGQIGGQVASSVLLLAAPADAKADRSQATELLLQMGVGNHAARGCSAPHWRPAPVSLRNTQQPSAGARVQRFRRRVRPHPMTVLHHELVRRGWS
jgi:hypothetical protein